MINLYIYSKSLLTSLCEIVSHLLSSSPPLLPTIPTGISYIDKNVDRKLSERSRFPSFLEALWDLDRSVMRRNRSGSHSLSWTGLYQVKEKSKAEKWLLELTLLDWFQPYRYPWLSLERHVRILGVKSLKSRMAVLDCICWWQNPNFEVWDTWRREKLGKVQCSNPQYQTNLDSAEWFQDLKVLWDCAPAALWDQSWSDYLKLGRTFQDHWD